MWTTRKTYHNRLIFYVTKFNSQVYTSTQVFFSYFAMCDLNTNIHGRTEI